MPYFARNVGNERTTDPAWAHWVLLFRLVPVAILGFSILMSVLGSSFLPEHARIVHHSSGATWPKDDALRLFPLSVGVAVFVAAVLLWARRTAGGVAALALAAFITVWQTVAFLAAAP